MRSIGMVRKMARWRGIGCKSLLWTTMYSKHYLDSPIRHCKLVWRATPFFILWIVFNNRTNSLYGIQVFQRGSRPIYCKHLQPFRLISSLSFINDLGGWWESGYNFGRIDQKSHKTKSINDRKMKTCFQNERILPLKCFGKLEFVCGVEYWTWLVWLLLEGSCGDQTSPSERWQKLFVYRNCFQNNTRV